jgi:hypothetical protein
MRVVYLLRSQKKPNQVHVGLCGNMKNRLAEHNAGECKTSAEARPMEERNASFCRRIFITCGITDVTRRFYFLPFNDRSDVFVLQLSCATKTLAISEKSPNGCIIKDLKVAFSAIAHDEYAIEFPETRSLWPTSLRQHSQKRPKRPLADMMPTPAQCAFRRRTVHARSVGPSLSFQ